MLSPQRVHTVGTVSSVSLGTNHQAAVIGMCVLVDPGRGAYDVAQDRPHPPKAGRQVVGGVCRSGWGRLLWVTNAIEPGTCCQGDSGWA